MIGQANAYLMPGGAYLVSSTRFKGDVHLIIGVRHLVNTDRSEPGVMRLRSGRGSACLWPTSAVTRGVTVSDLTVRIGVAQAGGSLWLRVDQFGSAQLLVAAANLPEPAIGQESYRAVVSWPGGNVNIPLVPATALRGVWIGNVALTLPEAAFTQGTIAVYPGPVLSAFIGNCR